MLEVPYLFLICSLFGDLFSFHHTSHTFSFLLHYIMNTEALVLMRSSNMVGLNKKNKNKKMVCGESQSHDGTSPS